VPDASTGRRDDEQSRLHGVSPWQPCIGSVGMTQPGIGMGWRPVPAGGVLDDRRDRRQGVVV